MKTLIISTILSIACIATSFASTNTPLVAREVLGYQSHHRTSTRLFDIGNESQKLKLGGTPSTLSEPTLQLNYVVPLTETNLSFAFKVGSLVRPGAVYTYVPSAGKNLTSQIVPGTSVMFPLVELIVIKTITEIGPAYTIAKTPTKANQLAGLGASMAIRQPKEGEIISGFEKALTHISFYAAASYDIDTSTIEPSAGFTIKF